MRQIRYIRVGQKPPNIFIQVLSAVAGLVFLLVAVLIGGVVLAVLLGLAIIIGLAVYMRLWWMRRKLAQPTADDQALEAEYRVVEPSATDHRPNDRRPDDHE